MSDIAFAPSFDERAPLQPDTHPAASTPAAPPLRIALVVEAAGGGVAVHLTDLICGSQKSRFVSTPVLTYAYLPF
ncbi:hypothetical protein K6Y56_38255, partial [Burkholderia cenocepacia]|nr:hypothetical protein [Burkholderia cenocepacia]